MCKNPLMKFRLGFIVGVVVGFLLGARDGRERYEKIVATFRKVRSNEQVREATALAERSTRGTRATAGRGMVAVADTVRARAAR